MAICGHRRQAACHLWRSLGTARKDNSRESSEDRLQLTQSHAELPQMTSHKTRKAEQGGGQGSIHGKGAVQ